MNPLVTADCAFETPRLRVGPWARLASELGLDLATVVANTLTETTTVALPEPWQGDYSRERAAAWIDERDRESPTCLVARSDEPIGLLILFEVPLDAETVDVRIGYILAERVWRQGLATELVAGLVAWARTKQPIATLTGGVAVTNSASARALTTNGFTSLDIDNDEEIFRREIVHGDE